ncbi:MAG: hypothetical protein ABI533_09540 [Betaproteobacteria bacterium]
MGDVDLCRWFRSPFRRPDLLLSSLHYSTWRAVAVALVAVAFSNAFAAFTFDDVAQRAKALAAASVAERALRYGLDALTPADKNQLIGDPVALSALRWGVWTTVLRHPSWAAMTAERSARVRAGAFSPAAQHEQPLDLAVAVQGSGDD